ncbi:MAG: hypothetical protein ACKPKR_19130 [Microcystis panniformis]
MSNELEQIEFSDTAVSPKHWTIISQVKSYRVVYFTDDENYLPPMEGDWYYVSPYIGELPKGMTLRNCWRWRFNGSDFVDAGNVKQQSQAEARLQRNRNALMAVLQEKIEALQRPHCPSSPFGHLAREHKFLEAQQLICGRVSEEDCPYLTNAADTYGLTIKEMAELIICKKAEFEADLLQTEQLRESFTIEIAQAQTDTELAEIWHRLMGEIAPEINDQFSVQRENTTPKQIGKMLTEEELAHEQVRLQVQLRERINLLRRTVVSDYLLDDAVLKIKGRIAQAVLMAGGTVPQGIDPLPLISYAAARGLSLEGAAREVLTEMDESAKILLKTEQIKNTFLSRIAATRSYQDIKAVSRDIQSLTLTGTHKT